MTPDSRLATSAPWYQDGLSFTCTGCGECCRGEGYVWVGRGEARSIAGFLGIGVRQFRDRYLRRVAGRASLIEKPNGDCVFWDKGCNIYPQRPTQCKTFPFWRDNLDSPGAWESVVSECPGAGTGRRYDLVEIRRLVRGRGGTDPGPTHGGGRHRGCHG